MPAFLDDISGFYGLEETNELGQDLEAFLDMYDPKKYDNPSVTADILVIKYKGRIDTVNTGLKLLMIKRKNHPSIGLWALPGGFVEIREDLEEAAKRELREETNLSGIPVEQLYTWGEYWRDPRSRIITTSFLALVDETVETIKAGDDAADAAWMDIELTELREEITKQNDKVKIVTRYKLVLVCKEKNIRLSAVVEKVRNAEGLLLEENFSVIENDGIAFDHPRFILHALMHLSNRMK